MKISRVAYVVNVFPKLSETFIAGELAELRRRGVELRVLSLRRPKESLRHEIITRAGLDKITCYRPDEFAGLLHEFRPQLLHAHFATEPTAAARELANELNLPFTFTAHGYDIHRKPPPDFVERAAAARAVVTVSHANARFIAQKFGVPNEHIRIIPCGVDTDRFCPAEVTGARGRTAALMTAWPLIVCVARLVRVKNHGLLLEACAQLRDRGVKFHCALIGDGPLRGDLEELHRQLGLKKVVRFTGALEQTEVLQWWQRATVAVLPSENEGMPVCPMEAGACGVPAAATAVGGVPELVQDGLTGLLTAPGDPEALAAALVRLLAEPELASRLGRAARQRAEETFSLRSQVNCLLRLWSELLDGEKRR